MSFSTSCGAHTASSLMFLGALILEVKQPGHEADHSRLSSAKVNSWSHTSTPPYVFMVWYVVKYRDKCPFTLPISFLQLCL
jgi:hypothetical protein